MRSIEVNEVKIYELTREHVVPEYLDPKKQSKLKKKDNLIANKLEVIYDLSMPHYATNITLSPDENFLFILGANSPRVRCYELEQMSMKFERNVDELPSKIAIIERDYSKFVLLEGQKTLDFHSQGGTYKKVKSREILTDIVYSNYNNKVYASTAKGCISLYDLNRGEIFENYNSETKNGGINSICYNNNSDLLMCGTRTSSVEVFDPRTVKKVSYIDISKIPNPEDVKLNYKSEVTKVNFKDHLKIGVGTDKGVCHIYDIRNTSEPWSSRDLDYRFPVSSISFYEDKVIASVGSVFKIWEPKESQEGEMFATYDVNKHINDFFHFPNSGLFLSATNYPKVGEYFIPRLGDAPKWCSKLTNLIITTEVESNSSYDTHTFVTLEELDELGLKHLIGTPSLRAYTHGYYINNNTYKKAKNHMELLNKKKTDGDATETQFSTEKGLVDEIPDPKINVSIKSLSVQDRFKSLFTDDVFAVDPSSNEFARVILQSKMIDKKRQKKVDKVEKAIKAHKRARMEDSDGEELEIESGSESD